MALQNLASVQNTAGTRFQHLYGHFPPPAQGRARRAAVTRCAFSRRWTARTTPRHMSRPDQSGGLSALGAWRPGIPPGLQCAEDAASAMYRLLVPALGRGLLRAAGRRCRVCSARLLSGPAGGRAPEVEVLPSRVAPPGEGSGLLPLLAGEGPGPGRAGPAARAGTGARAGPGDLRAPSHSTRVVFEARCGRGGGGAAGSGRGGPRGCGGRGRGRNHPAAEASQGEAALWLCITLSSLPYSR